MFHAEQELVIFTRSKLRCGLKKRTSEWANGAAGAKSRMVKLKVETLQEYFAYPLGTAAKALGLSETSLKRYGCLQITFFNSLVSNRILFMSSACRKLGLPSWPYRKVSTK
jgi:hypothetical protein